MRSTSNWSENLLDTFIANVRWKILTRFDDLASFCGYLATTRRYDSALHRFTAPLENVVETKATRSYRRRKGERRKLDKKRERKTGKESEWDRAARSRGGGWTFYARRAKDAFESLIPFETLILGAKWRERGVFFGWMTYWTSFVCRCVRGRLIQSPMAAYTRYTYYVLSFFSFHIVRDRVTRNVRVCTFLSLSQDSSPVRRFSAMHSRDREYCSFRVIQIISLLFLS